MKKQVKQEPGTYTTKVAAQTTEMTRLKDTNVKVTSLNNRSANIKDSNPKIVGLRDTAMDPSANLRNTNSEQLGPKDTTIGKTGLGEIDAKMVCPMDTNAQITVLEDPSADLKETDAEMSLSKDGPNAGCIDTGPMKANMKGKCPKDTNGEITGPEDPSTEITGSKGTTTKARCPENTSTEMAGSIDTNAEITGHGDHSPRITGFKDITTKRTGPEDTLSTEMIEKDTTVEIESLGPKVVNVGMTQGVDVEISGPKDINAGQSGLKDISAQMKSPKDNNTEISANAKDHSHEQRKRKSELQLADIDQFSGDKKLKLSGDENLNTQGDNKVVFRNCEGNTTNKKATIEKVYLPADLSVEPLMTVQCAPVKTAEFIQSSPKETNLTGKTYHETKGRKQSANDQLLASESPQSICTPMRNLTHCQIANIKNDADAVWTKDKRKPRRKSEHSPCADFSKIPSHFSAVPPSFTFSPPSVPFLPFKPPHTAALSFTFSPPSLVPFLPFKPPKPSFRCTPPSFTFAPPMCVGKAKAGCTSEGKSKASLSADSSKIPQHSSVTPSSFTFSPPSFVPFLPFKPPKSAASSSFTCASPSFTFTPPKCVGEAKAGCSSDRNVESEYHISENGQYAQIPISDVCLTLVKTLAVQNKVCG